VKALGARYPATTTHLVVSAFVAMRLISGPNDEIYMRVDRERATRVRLWTGNDSQSQDFAPGNIRRI
jgi:hypothetical protein